MEACSSVNDTDTMIVKHLLR